MNKNKIILLIEDNPDHAELIRRGLRDHDARAKLTHLADGEEGLDYLLRRGGYRKPESSPRPTLILLDLRLPKVDGLEVLERIKQHDEIKRIPVVILTTSEDDDDLGRAYDLHANSYLVKPVDFGAFGKLLEELGLYWLVENRPPPEEQSAARV